MNASTMNQTPAISFGQESFQALRDTVFHVSGISLDQSKHALVRTRLAKRMRELSISTGEEYISILKSNQNNGEMDILLNAISTNFTSFFRENEHFNLFRFTPQGDQSPHNEISLFGQPLVALELSLTRSP